MFGDNLKCVSRDPGLLLCAARFTTGYVRLVGQEPVLSKCVLMSTSRAFRRDMWGWVVTDEGYRWSVKLDVRDLVEHLDTTFRGWSATLAKRVRLVISGREISVSAVPFGPGTDIFALVGSWEAFFRALRTLPGGFGRFILCDIGANHCRLRHIGWEKCGHGLTSRPRETAAGDFLNELLVLFRYPPRSAAALLGGTLRDCTVKFAGKVPTWRLPVDGHVLGLVTARGGVDAGWSEHGAVLAVLGAVGDAGVNWRRRKKSPTKQKNSSTPCWAWHFGDSGSTKGLDASRGSGAFRFWSLMPRLGGCIRVAETMLQVWSGRELAEAFGGMHEPTSPGFCMLL